ncbi:MAG TPA: hypothetical protein IAB32_06030 [Candidatus Scatosoma pullicola]|nr:hypothetical protein [Candidatus Scatosoma pullicola]
MKFAIIDISSSSISLLAAEGEKTFDILFRERENVSILHYMEGKNLSERGVEKIAENLGKMKEICRKAGIDKCYVISTASMRNFENFEWVIEELYKRVAVRVNLLDGQEEAYCDLVSNERYRALDRAVLADIGGGSIELCDLTKDNPDSLVYLDFGPIQINHRFVANIHPTEGEAKDIKKYVRKKLEKSGLPGGGALSTAVLVGATNQAIYDVYCDYYDEERAAGEKRIEYDRLKKLCKHLVRSSDRSMLVLKNAPEKIYTLTTATVILRAMLKYFGVSNVVVSEFGVKEGYLSLVTDGRWKGVETDLDEVPEGVSVPAPVEEQPVAEKKAGKGRKAAKAAKAEKAEEKPAAKRRGRPKKAVAEEKPAEVVTEVKAEEKPAAKRRGRPKKAVAEEKPAEVAEEVKAEEKPAAKRRGRPKKAVAEEKPAEVVEEVKAEEKPVVKRRGRPKKAVAEEKPAEVAVEVKATEPEATETAPAEIVTEVKAEEKPAARPARRRRARTVKAAETEEEVKPARRTRRKAEKPADKDPAEAKPVRRTRRKVEKSADKELAEVKPVRRTRRKAAKPAAPEMPEIPEGATPEDIAEIIRTAAAEAGVPVEITFEESVSETAEAPASDAPAETVGTPEAAEAAEVTERAESVQAEPARAAEETAPAAEAGKEENGDQGV